MAMSLRSRTRDASLPRITALLSLPRLAHAVAKGSSQAQVAPGIASGSDVCLDKSDMSKWKKFDARRLGITRSMIPSHSWITMSILRREGFDAYLVGGCVRDLVLNRIPKDFDVITTAKLEQIKKIFHHAFIVGRRFPICRVKLQGSVVEVSSFTTKARNSGDKEKVSPSYMATACAEKDFLLWRDSMTRDFTINSLFLDPFLHKVYDYAGGLADLRSLKLQTLIPAKLSFTEDGARILRGIRIAARLGLSFSNDTEDAIQSLASSITCLPKDRIMLELNYMFSYGAAEPSFRLLWRFSLLKMIFPLHSAYLDQQDTATTSQSSLMLMRLFFNLDKLVSCDRPSHSSIWVALLAFHLAVLNNPQDALVIWAFASVLYFGSWERGTKFAREHAQHQVNFVPEISGSSSDRSVDLAEKVSHLASLVQESLSVLCDSDSQMEPIPRQLPSSSSGLVYISKKVASDVGEIFKVMVEDVETYSIARTEFDINYESLQKGYLKETRLVLGKIIIETMISGNDRAEEIIDVAKTETDDLRNQIPVPKNAKKRRDKKKLARDHNLLEQEATSKKRGVDKTDECNDEVEKHQKSLKESESSQGERSVKKRSVLDKQNCHLNAGETSCKDPTCEQGMEPLLKVDAVKKVKDQFKQELVNERNNSPSLSSLFK